MSDREIMDAKGYFGTPEANKKRYEEIRKEVDAIKSRQTTKKSKPIEELLANVKISKKGSKDAAYARSRAKAKAKKK